MRNDLRDARVKANLTQARLAELIGRDQASISRYESGEAAIGTDIAPVIADALGLSVLEVLYPKQPSSNDRAA